MARPSAKPVSPPPGVPATGRIAGVVLLVEDEPSVRTVTKRMLEMRGLTVLLAENPEEALRQAATHPHPVDVLLTDVLLPGMDGPELASRIRMLRPDVRVVFISGYPREEAFAHSANDPEAEFLQKPFTPARLIEVLSRVLSKSAATPPPAVGNTQKLPPPEPPKP